MVVAAPFRGHQKGLAILKEMPVISDVDIIIIGFIVEHPAFARSGVGGQNLQMVLMAVEALYGQHIGIFCPSNARQVNVSLSACIPYTYISPLVMNP